MPHGLIYRGAGFSPRPHLPAVALGRPAR